MRYKDFFIEFINFGKRFFEEEHFKFLSLDFIYINCYSPYKTTQKGTYNNYLNIEIDIFWRRYLISVGIIKVVEYEVAFKEFKKRQKERMEKEQNG